MSRGIFMLVVAAFYQFFRLPVPQKIKAELDELIAASDIYGTILLAHEGINGTVCGSREHIDKLRAYFLGDPHLAPMEYKESESVNNPFIRRHVKIKDEIVTLGQPVDTVARTGQHVNAREWDALLDDPSVHVIDVRNRYETALGGFVGAQDPGTDSFRDFADYVKESLDPAVHKRIAMSCTGGIRCEKASAYLLQCGFDEVYQLDGGVLRYLEDTQKQKSKWRGECFVFDNRVTVDHDLKPGSYTMCFACRAPLSVDDKISADYIEAVACPHCRSKNAAQQQDKKRMRHEQILLAKARGGEHIGPHAMSKKRANVVAT